MPDPSRRLRKTKTPLDLAPADIDKLRRWWSQMIEQVENAIVTTKEMLTLHNADWVRNQLTYHKNVLSAAKWFRWNMMPTRKAKAPDVDRNPPVAG